jgi:hypothetical protein
MKIKDIKRYPNDGELHIFENALVKCFRTGTNTLSSVRIKTDDESVFYSFSVKEDDLASLIQHILNGECEGLRCHPEEFHTMYDF